MNNRQHTIDQTVHEIRTSSAAHFFRDPDRACARVVPVRRKQDPAVVRAKSQARTAAWRVECDRKRRPEAREIGMALVIALVTSDDRGYDLTLPEYRFASRALDDLEQRGFDREQVKLVLRRIRRNLVEDDGRNATVDGPAAPESGGSKYF